MIILEVYCSPGNKGCEFEAGFPDIYIYINIYINIYIYKYYIYIFYIYILYKTPRLQVYPTLTLFNKTISVDC